MAKYDWRQSVPTRRRPAICAHPLDEILAAAASTWSLAATEVPPKRHACDHLRKIVCEHVPTQEADPAPYGFVEVEFREGAISPIRTGLNPRILRPPHG